MGNYTEIRVDLTLRPDAPAQVRDALLCMYEEGACLLLPDHPLFRTERWRHMLLGGSAYFEAEPSHSVEFDPGVGTRFRSVSNFKDYDGEGRLFAEWVRSHCAEQEEPIVTLRPGSDTGDVTAYYADGRKVTWRDGNR